MSTLACFRHLATLLGLLRSANVRSQTPLCIDEVRLSVGILNGGEGFCSALQFGLRHLRFSEVVAST
jgi:hypothetical protein